MFFGQLKGVFQTFANVHLQNSTQIDEIRPKGVNQGVEGQTVAPTRGEIAHVQLVELTKKIGNFEEKKKRFSPHRSGSDEE